MVDTDCTDLHRTDAESGRNISTQRPLRLSAQPLDPARRVVAAQCGQVDAADRLNQPRRLIFLLHGPPRDKTGRTAVRGIAVDAEMAQPVQVKGAAFVATH